MITDPFTIEEVESRLNILHTVASHSASLPRLNTNTRHNDLSRSFITVKHKLCVN